MMPSALLEENGRAHFMTKRFDREAGSVKHHIQSFCALKHYDYNLVNSFSYEQLFQTMRELNLPYPAAEQLFRRMVFNVMARNCDDHTKNFAFRLKKDGKWELAPAYDICHAYSPNHQWVSRHALSINGKRSNITREDLLTIGKSIKNKKAAETIDHIGSVIKNWKEFADAVEVSPTLRDEIAETLIRL
jgi:serine/threonine-protein kinase HipA